MKARKFFFKFIILAAIAAAVFVCGWVSLFVDTETRAVMTTKLGGTSKNIVYGNAFHWSYHHLIPKNTKLTPFSLKDTTITSSIKGKLPSADIYSSQLPLNPVFDYNFNVKVSYSVSDQQLLSLYTENKVLSQGDLESYLKNKTDVIVQSLAEILFADSGNLFCGSYEFSQEQIKSLVEKNKAALSDVELKAVTIQIITVPDIQLYNEGKKLYENYISYCDEQLKESSKLYAKDFIAQDKAIERLAHFAELMDNHPHLAELAKNGQISAIIESLSSMR